MSKGKAQVMKAGLRNRVGRLSVKTRSTFEVLC